MIRKDYELIANAIEATIESEKQPEGGGYPAVNALQALAARLAEDLSEENARFDAEKFIAACGANR